MQIEHHVGIVSQQHQRALQRGVFIHRVPGRQTLAPGCANHFEVVVDVLPQETFDFLRDLLMMNRKMAVVVAPTAQLETSTQCTHDVLAQPRRIGHGHQNDFVLQPIGFFQGDQVSAHNRRHQHGGDFISVQRGLDVNLAALSGRSVMLAVDVPAAAVCRLKQWVFAMFHKVKLSSSKVGRPLGQS
ncbi:hypothetical protein D3C85_820550 [compost metagenome]